MTFVELPIEVNAEAMIEEAFEEMRTQFPDWEPNEGNPEVFLIRAIAVRMIQPLAELAADAGGEIFARYGELIANVTPHSAVAATIASTWKMVDSAGYTIPAGTQVDVATAGDEAIGFRVVSDVVVAPASSETAAGEVLLEAIEPGAEANGLSAGATLVDALSYVKTITLVGESSGGTDAEDPDAYLSRLAEMMQTQAPRPIIARDVAILLRSIAGIQRVGVKDLYNDTTKKEGTEAEKTLSAYPLDAEGQPVSAAIAEEADELLEEKREVNFVFIIGTPTFNKIDVTAEVHPREGYEGTAAEEAKRALEEMLDSAKWGQLPLGDDTTWDIAGSTKLRYQDVVTVLNNVQGVAYYSKLEIGFNGKAKGTADLTLEGAAPLPEVGLLSVTAV